MDFCAHLDAVPSSFSPIFPPRVFLVLARSNTIPKSQPSPEFACHFHQQPVHFIHVTCLRHKGSFINALVCMLCAINSKFHREKIIAKWSMLTTNQSLNSVEAPNSLAFWTDCASATSAGKSAISFLFSQLSAQHESLVKIKAWRKKHTMRLMHIEGNNCNGQCGIFLVSRSGIVSRKSEGVCRLHKLRADCHPGLRLRADCNQHTCFLLRIRNGSLCSSVTLFFRRTWTMP